jgi:excisionase family DNA binding protein
MCLEKRMNDPTLNPDRLLTVAETADYLNCSVRMIRRIVAERRVPFVRIGRHVRFRVSALEDFLQAGSVAAYDGHDR